MTAAEVHEQEGTIRHLHERRVDTALIHETVKTNGKRLGAHAKQKVSGRGMRLVRVSYV